MTECYERKQSQFVGLFFRTKPVSVNAIWRSFVRGKRVATIKSQAYRDFIREAGAELEAQKPCCVPGPFSVRIALHKGSRLDVDNACKVFLDLLALHGVIENDRHCQRLEIWRGGDERTMVQVISTRGE